LKCVGGGGRYFRFKLGGEVLGNFLNVPSLPTMLMAHMAKNHSIAIVVGLILFGQTLKVIIPIMLEWLELSTQRGFVIL